MDKMEKFENRCIYMANNFTLREGCEPTYDEVKAFGSAIKIALDYLRMAHTFANKNFRRNRAEYNIINGIVKELELYRNFMDNEPVEVMLPNTEEHILNKVFYGDREKEKLKLKKDEL